MDLRRAAVGLLAAVIGVGGLAACDPAPAPRVQGRGAYVGRPTPEAVEDFSDWAGPPATTHIHSFIPQGREGTRGFDEINGWIDDVLPLVEQSSRRLVLSVPLVPAGSTLGSVADGDGHRRLTKLARALRASGRGRAVIRLGWESNGTWFRWNADDDRQPFAYRRAFRRVVQTLRAAAPRLRFEWNVVCELLPDAPRWYPGDRDVDLVGQDCYARTADQWARWQRALDSVAAFAQRHGKLMAVSEWGTCVDDPGLVRSFLRWAQEHSIAYHLYWNLAPGPNECDTRLAGLPQAAQAYRENGT
jgi:hypothetical protein